jgi:very-short-patch-repair endonuclease
MRKEMTPHEKAMWRLLHDGELVALNWRRQATFGAYILDFVSHPARLVIEVDGSQHAQPENAKLDAERTAWLRTQGYTVLRFWNHEALKARDGVWRAIQATAAATTAKARMQRWRVNHLTQIQQANAQIASSSMEEAPRSGGGGAPSGGDERASRGPSVNSEGAPPQSAANAPDSSSIEEERT